jgi:hypothetical protein
MTRNAGSESRLTALRTTFLGARAALSMQGPPTANISTCCCAPDALKLNGGGPAAVVYRSVVRINTPYKRSACSICRCCVGTMKLRT